jgi:hypothetical protein
MPLRSRTPDFLADLGQADKEPLIVPIEDGAADAVLAVCAALNAARRAAREPNRRAAAEEVFAASGALAREAAGWLLRADGAPASAELAAAAETYRGHVAGRLGDAVFRGFPRSLRDARPALLQAGAAALRTAALEYHRSELMLGHEDGRRPVAVSTPLAESQAHVLLMQPLYERVERWVAGSGAPGQEREAARWWFSRWRPAQPARGDEFARVVREQEFSLVERPLITLGNRTVIGHMLGEGLLDDLPPRQRAVAEGLAGSAAAVWEVVSRAGEHASFRDPMDGEMYSVVEHGGAEYGLGSVAVGRLIPFAGGTFLRSPGMAIIPASEVRPGMAGAMAEGVEESSEEVMPSAVIEGMIQVMFGIRNLPRKVPLPVSPDQAVMILRDLNTARMEVGAAQAVDPADVPERLRGAENVTVLGGMVDIVFADYLGEMFPLSQKSKLYRQMASRRAAEEKARKRGG